MLKQLIRIEKTTEIPAYVHDEITRETRAPIGDEFAGRNITHYTVTFANYLEFSFFVFPIDGDLDKIIPCWFWTTKKAVPRKYAEK